jgi:hypothetical protein
MPSKRRLHLPATTKAIGKQPKSNLDPKTQYAINLLIVVNGFFRLNYNEKTS